MNIQFLCSFPGGIPSSMIQDVYAKAYDKLKDGVSSHSEMGVGLGEFGQSCGMAGKRAGELIGLANDLRKFDFVGAANRLRMSVVPKGVSKSKSFGSNWLEYSFGWKPLIQDIYSAVDVLQNPIKSLRPSGSATGTVSHREVVGSKTNWMTTGYSEKVYNWTFSAKMGCEVTINNPNLFLANNLGLINPMTVVWELIPFSFVIDWVANVGQVLQSGTDFLGLTVSNGWNTFYERGSVFEDQRNPFWVTQINQRWGTGAKMSRNLGLIYPELHARPWKIPGWPRFANAIGVLLVGLRK
jgi:hypothetical protein